MPPAPVPAAVDAFLRTAHPAVIASVRPDGAPHSAATWYDWVDGRLLLSMDDSRLRLSFLRRDPRVSLTVLDTESWYRHITLTGHVTEMHPDEDLRDIDRLAMRYTGEPYPNRTSPRTTAWVTVERWHGWDAAGAILTHAEWDDSAGS